MNHWCVVGLVQCAEARSKGAYTLIAVHLQVEDLHRERVAGFSSFDVERAGERVVPLYQAQSVAGLLNGIAEGIHCIGFEDIGGFESGDRLSHAINVFHVVHGDVVLHAVLRADEGMENCQQSCQHQNSEKWFVAHGSSVTVGVLCRWIFLRSDAEPTRPSLRPQ